MTNSTFGDVILNDGSNGRSSGLNMGDLREEFASKLPPDSTIKRIEEIEARLNIEHRDDKFDST